MLKSCAFLVSSKELDNASISFQPQNDKEKTSVQSTNTSKEYDQMKHQINQAVYMDFIETVAENDISNMLTIELLKFFESHEGIMNESLVYPLGKSFLYCLHEIT